MKEKLINLSLNDLNDKDIFKRVINKDFNYYREIEKITLLDSRKVNLVYKVDYDYVSDYFIIYKEYIGNDIYSEECCNVSCISSHIYELINNANNKYNGDSL